MKKEHIFSPYMLAFGVFVLIGKGFLDYWLDGSFSILSYFTHNYIYIFGVFVYYLSYIDYHKKEHGQD